MEGVDPVMTALIAAAVVDPASRNDRHVRAICDVKIIVYKIRHTGNADNDRNIDLLTLCLAVDIDIDPRLVRLLFDLDVLTVPVADGSSVLTQVESAFLGKSIVIDDFQYFFYYMIQLYHYALTPAFPAHV